MKYKLTNNKTLELIQDSDGENPREWDNLGKMICFHKNYILGDDHRYSSSDFSGWEDMKKDLIKLEDAAIILPLYLYDHSGITMSTSPFSCPWDSGQVGYIVISKKKVREEYSVTRISKQLLQRITDYLITEVGTYDQYLTGDIWGFKVINEEGEEEDSCWGFFGSDPKTNGMLEHISETIID